MSIRISKLVSTLLIASTGFSAVLANTALAQDLVYIQHKPTGNKMQVCDGPLGTPVTSRPNANAGPCVKWELVPNGDYFYIRSFDADKFIKPDTAEDGSPISIQPTTWRGNWVQWSYEERGEGFGHIINRGTGKQIFLNGKNRANLEQQPSSWRGDFTRWAFISVDSPIVTPTPSLTPTPFVTPTPVCTGCNETPAPVADTVSISNSASLGDFLVAGDDHPAAGMTLYTWIGDEGVPFSRCTGGCAQTWPPFTVPSADVLQSPSVDVVLGTHTRSDGSIQVTFNNEPLYFYNLDVFPGDTNGHNVGGTWYVADILSDPTPSPTPTLLIITPPPTPTPVANVDGFCLSEGPGGATVSHPQLPDPASGDQYLCLNGNCQRASLNNGTWSSSGFGNVSGLIDGQGYELKAQLTGCNNVSVNVTYSDGKACVVSECLPPDVTPPTVPSGLNGTAKNGRAIDLTWSPSSDDRGVAKYEILVNGVLEGSSSSTSYSISGLTENTTYSLSVIACDASNNCSSPSQALSVNTGIFTPDTTPPTVPSGLRGEGESLTTISLSWNPSSDQLGVVASYRIYRDGSLVGNTGATSYLDSGLETATTYSYRVDACDDSDNCSVRSSALQVQTERPDFGNLDWTSNSFITGKGVGPGPRPDPIAALRTPISGIAPRNMGFAFDIEGSTVNWRFGGSTPNAGGVEFSCSVDGNMTFETVSVNGSATIPAACTSAGTYTYFFRYLHPHSLNNDPAHQWIYTGLFTTAGGKFNPYAPGAYSFTDGTANWARIRHPITTDGITAAVLDRPNAGELLRNLDRYLMWVDDSSGFVDFNMDVSFMSTDDPRVPQDVVPGFRRNEALRSAAGGPNGQQFFMVNTASRFGDDYRTAPQSELEGFEDTFSYGQVISFEFSVEAAGQSPAQTYNDFSHYVVGCGFCGKYGDPRLNSAGKAGTSQVFSDAGQYIGLERNAIFTQPMTTVHSEKAIDDFIVGHHLFHGIDPKQANIVNSPTRNMFDNPEVYIGEFACGSCHFRDGRGDRVFDTPDGPRLPPPVYGVALLEWIEGRATGFGWEGKRATVLDQVRSALIVDHKVNPDHLPPEVLELITHYVNVLSVPDRNPGSYDQPGVTEGDKLFNEIGCADCHTPIQRTRSDAPEHIRNLVIRPYTDMKLWDIGTGGAFRTAPLWGLGQNLRLFGYNGKSAIYMHDGSASSVHEAILQHGGDAAQSRTRYQGLSGGDQTNIVNFVETL